VKMPLWLAYDHWTALRTAEASVARQMAQASDTSLVPGTQAFLEKVSSILSANSPELIKAFIGLFQQVHAGTFTEAEIQSLLLTNAVTNSCVWAVAFHTMLALEQDVAAADVDAIRARRAPADKRLAALSILTRKLIETRGHVVEQDLTAFVEAGFEREQTPEILAVIAASTITNYAGTMAEPPLEDFLERHAWQA